MLSEWDSYVPMSLYQKLDTNQIIASGLYSLPTPVKMKSQHLQYKFLQILAVPKVAHAIKFFNTLNSIDFEEKPTCFFSLPCSLLYELFSLPKDEIWHALEFFQSILD